MVQARFKNMPADSLGSFHVVSRCAEDALLVGGSGKSTFDRRDWLVEELQGLLSGFAVELQAYAILPDRLHLVLRPRPDKAAKFSALQVARLGMQQMPVRTGVADESLPLTKAVFAEYAAQPDWVAGYRERLSSVSWFMRLLKQRLATRINRDEDCRGSFWQSRFTAIPLLDLGAVVSCMVYIDLAQWRDASPVSKRAGSLLDAGRYTSLAAHAGLKLAPETAALSKQLCNLSQSKPQDMVSGALGRAKLTTADYRCLVAALTGEKLPRATEGRALALLEDLGFAPAWWLERMQDAGLFESGIVGNAVSRQHYAVRQGKKWIVDKTRLWPRADA